VFNGATLRQAKILSVGIGLVLLAACAPQGVSSIGGGHHSTTTTTTKTHRPGGGRAGHSGSEETTTTTDGSVTTTPTTRPSTTTTTAPTATTAPPTTVPAAGGTSGTWKPTSAHSLGFQWVLGGALNMSDPVQMGLRDFNGNTLAAPDIYDIDGEENSAATVAALHAQGKKVVCYMDAGVYETYRTDASSFPSSVIGSPDSGWDGSYWLDVRQISILAPIMQARIAMCKSKGFDAVEPDEIDGYSNDPGFPISYAQQIAYNTAFAGWVHAAGMSVLLKGDIDQAVDLQPSFDFTLNEECDLYSECSPGLDSFANAGKAVFIAEYPDDDPTPYPVNLTGSACLNAQAKHFNLSWYKLGLPNDGGREPCPQTW
jgi:hypothetical protein